MLWYRKFAKMKKAASDEMAESIILACFLYPAAQNALLGFGYSILLICKPS